MCGVTRGGVVPVMSGILHLDSLFILYQHAIDDTIPLLLILMTSLVAIKRPQALVISNKDIWVLLFTNKQPNNSTIPSASEAYLRDKASA